MSAEIVQTVLDDGIKSAGVLLLVVLSWKLYKLKCETMSQCCDGFKFSASNSGSDESLGDRLSNSV